MDRVVQLYWNCVIMSEALCRVGAAVGSTGGNDNDLYSCTIYMLLYKYSVKQYGLIPT